jgi:hypothetical protein
MPFEYVQGVHLQRTAESVDEIEALVAACGGRVGTDVLLAELDQRARRSWAPARKTGIGLSWERKDRGDRRWWPQGVTSSADASPSERVAGRRVLLVSWYAKKIGGVGQGTRISVLDLDSRRYRHVLLARAVIRDGTVGLEPLTAHAGGIVWSGPYLHVAATRKGFHTVRIEDLVRVTGPLREESFGYEYVLPVRFSYTAFHDDGHEPLRYSFISLDRSTDEPALIAGEYGRGSQTTRLARYPLDPESHHLVTGEDGYSRPLLLEEQGEAGMQGAAVVGGRWYVSSSRGPLWFGSLYVGTPGRFRRVRCALPIGPEDLTYWPSTDTLWSASEWPWRRWVFPVKRSRLG